MFSPLEIRYKNSVKNRMLNFSPLSLMSKLLLHNAYGYRFRISYISLTKLITLSKTHATFFFFFTRFP